MANIVSRIWSDERFASLENDQRVVYFYFCTCSGQPVPGLIEGGVPSWTYQGRFASHALVERAVEHLITLRLVEYDVTQHLLRVPAAPKYNPPGNPNVLRGWYRRWLQLPTSPLRLRHIPAIGAALWFTPEGMPRTLSAKSHAAWNDVWRETFGTVHAAPAPTPQRELFAVPAVGTSPGSRLPVSGIPFADPGSAPGTVDGTDVACDSTLTYARGIVTEISPPNTHTDLKSFERVSKPFRKERDPLSVILDPRSSSGREGKAFRKPFDAGQTTADEASAIGRVLATLSEVSGVAYSPAVDAFAEPVLGQLRAGHDPDELEAMVLHRGELWAKDEMRAEWLRPSTLFGDKCDEYLARSRANSEASRERAADRERRRESALAGPDPFERIAKLTEGS